MPEALTSAPTINEPHEGKLRAAIARKLAAWGGMARFSLRFFKEVFKPPYEWREIIRHFDDLGARSMVLITIVNFIMGLILAMQTRPTMVKFGAAAFIPGMVATSITRELGPVISALLVAGRVASGIGAELGSMKVSEQIDALECIGIDPYRYLVVTRVVAMTLLMPLICLYAITIGIFGAYIAEAIAVGVTPRYFFDAVVRIVNFEDWVPSMVKCAFFGFAIAMVGAHKGFTTESGTEGVGRATTSAVVVASLWVLLIDMVMVKLTVTWFY